MKPALSLAAVAGRRRATIELAQEIERRGYPGIYMPSFGDAMGLGVALALTTQTIQFGTTVQPIYLRQPADFAAQAAFMRGDVKTARQLATRAKTRLPVGSPAWVRADDIVSVKPPTAANK